MYFKLIFLFSIFGAYLCQEITNTNKPNIVFIVGDDIGWNDVSLHGSDQIMTPNIDMIGLQGVVLENYYTDTQGTPSRSAMFTGKYSMHTGTQGISIGAAEDRGLSVSEKLLPSYLQELGYVTHLVGKWQLGKSREHYLPTNRGFDTFYGFLDGSVDYYTYNHIESCNGSNFFGLDLYDNLEPVFNQTGHLTHVLTDRAVKVIEEHDPSVPLYIHIAHAAAHTGGGLVNLQPPLDTLSANGHIAHSARRMYAGLVTDLDKCVGQIVAALAEKGILNNTMLIFVSDNGAPTGSSQNFGSNLPLRGTKSTPWEGSVRVPAVLWHPEIKSKIWKGLFHVTDWLPTLLSAAGGNAYDVIDGIDQWFAIMNDEKPPRTNAVIAVDDLNEWGAFRDGDFKIIVGNVDKCTSEYYGQQFNLMRYEPPLYENALLDSETYLIFREMLGIAVDLEEAIAKRNYCTLPNKNNTEGNTTACIPTKERGCLFNISADPEEVYDLWDSETEIVQQMRLRFRLLWTEVVPRSPPVFDNRSDPSLLGFAWSPWLNDTEDSLLPIITLSQYPLKLSIDEMQYYVDINLKVFKDKLNVYFKSMTETFMSSVSNMFS